MPLLIAESSCAGMNFHLNKIIDFILIPDGQKRKTLNDESVRWPNICNINSDSGSFMQT